MTFGYQAFFLTFSWKNPDENDIGCLILDIWVSSFFFTFSWKNPDKNVIGCLILDIWVSSFFEHFHGKIHTKLTWDAEFPTFGYQALFDISMEKIG